MKYIEELENGESFESDGCYFILTHDFKKNGDKFCIQLDNGFGRWFKSDNIVNLADIFTMDKDNNLIAIRERAKNNVSNQT